MSLLILDGMDRCGKTTVARKIQDVHERPLHVLHNGPPPKALDRADARVLLLRQYVAQVAMASAMDSHDFIVDRSWPSESVYGRVYRGLPAIDAEWQALVAKALSKVPHVVVILADSAEAVNRRTDGHSTFERQCADRGHCRPGEDVTMEARFDHASQECVAFHEEHAALVRAGVNARWYHRRGPQEVANECMKILRW